MILDSKATSRFKLFLFLISIFLMSEKVAFCADDPATISEAKSCSFTLGALNVENLHPTFLTKPDQVAEFTAIESLQHTGLSPVAGPATRRPYNWTEPKLAVKLEQTRKLVSSLPQKPAVLGIIEVRESTSMGKLARVLDYSEPIISSSISERGMDVGLLLNPSAADQKIISTEEVPLVGPEFEWHPTRNLLVTTVLVADRFLLHYVVAHWPSQGGPTDSRNEAARQTRVLVEKLLFKFPGSEAIAFGDFNTLEDEQDVNGNHPFRDVLTQGTGPSRLIDLYTVPEVRADIPQPPGTYYYAPKDQWNHLDRYFVTAGLLEKKPTGLRIIPKSFFIHAPEFATVEFTRPSGEKIRVPLRYDFEAETTDEAGYTDHSPLSVGVEARWQETKGAEIKFTLDQDVFLLNSVVLYPKKAGSRRFIPYREYLAQKDLIGKSGTYENFEIRDESLSHLKDSPTDVKNYVFADAKYEMEKADPLQWQGPQWDALLKNLNDPELARRVVIEIPEYRSHRPESIYQLLLALVDRRLIKYLPPLANIRAKP